MFPNKIHYLRAKRLSFINQIRQYVKLANSQNKEVSYKKLIAVLCLDFGVSKRNCKETIDLLIDVGEFRLTEDIVFYNNNYQGATS